MEDLIKQNCQNIIHAESQNSDLVPAIYEGEFKIFSNLYADTKIKML